MDQRPNFLEWRFDKTLLFVFVHRLSMSPWWWLLSSRKKTREDQFSAKEKFPFELFFDGWASGLGIGFCLRGVQARTTVR